MKPAMYIFINKGLGMSGGKIGAQAGHAAVEAALISNGSAEPITEEMAKVWDAWRVGKHYMKLVMEAQSQEHLLVIERYLNDRGFKTALIIDEGHTEVAPITATALGVQVVDKDDPHTAATFASFKLYKDPKPEPTRPYPDTGVRQKPRWWQGEKKMRGVNPRPPKTTPV